MSTVSLKRRCSTEWFGTFFEDFEPKWKTVVQSICTLISNLSGRPDIFLGSRTIKKYVVYTTNCSRSRTKWYFCLLSIYGRNILIQSKSECTFQLFPRSCGFHESIYLLFLHTKYVTEAAVEHIEKNIEFCSKINSDSPPSKSNWHCQHQHQCQSITESNVIPKTVSTSTR